jgi:hypothetical protein
MSLSARRVEDPLQNCLFSHFLLKNTGILFRSWKGLPFTLREVIYELGARLDYVYSGCGLQKRDQAVE